MEAVDSFLRSLTSLSLKKLADFPVLQGSLLNNHSDINESGREKSQVEQIQTNAWKASDLGQDSILTLYTKTTRQGAQTSQIL